MALGKLWNAFFGKRTDDFNESTSQRPAVVDRANIADRATAADTMRSAATSTSPPANVAADSSRTAAAPPKREAVTEPAPLATQTRPAQPAASSQPAAIADSVPAPAAWVAKKPRLAGTPTGKKKHAVKPDLTVAAAETSAAAANKRSIPTPKKNSWTKLVAGKSIGAILETRLGQATRAGEVLEAIVCDAVATPKLVAIDSFEQSDCGVSVLQFHQRVRAAGGQPVPVPGNVADGLRQLSRTLGTVDLVLWEPANPQWLEEETQRLLSRVTHPQTTVLRQSPNGQWESVALSTIIAPQVAASRAA